MELNQTASGDRRLRQGLPLRCGSSYAAASAPTSLEPPTLFECAQNPRLKQQTCCMACAQKTTMLPHTLSVLWAAATRSSDSVAFTGSSVFCENSHFLSRFFCRTPKCFFSFLIFFWYSHKFHEFNFFVRLNYGNIEDIHTCSFQLFLYSKY